MAPRIHLAALVIVAGTAPAGMAGCRVFDESLLEQHASEGEEAEHHGEGGEEVALADECFSSVPVLESAPGHRIVSTIGGRDDMRTYSACGVSKELPGPEAFFSLEAVAGDRWHIAVTPEDEADVATVILGNCDVATCVAVMDRCGPGLTEEYTLVVDQPRAYFVAVETAMADVGTEAEVIALRTVCGDGVTDHGETCDDGNLDPGDGCDPECRLELGAATSQESEPNNWHTEANVLIASEPTRRVVGTLGGPCDTDEYLVTVPEGTTLSVVMSSGAELPCTNEVEIEMLLIQGSTGVTRGMGQAGRMGGDCPSLEVGDAFNEGLPAGDYHIVLAAAGNSPTFDYVLRVDVTPAT